MIWLLTPLALYLFLLFVVVPLGILAEKLDAIRHRYITISAKGG